MQIVADRLGLAINPVKIEWSGVIASVQAGRMDVLGGQVGWTEERTKILRAFRSHQLLSERNRPQGGSAGFSKLADLEGKAVGTITGFSFIPELQKIKDINLSFYDNQDAALRDLLAGRVEAVIADPPAVGYAIKQNPDWKIAFTPFSDDNPDFPLLTGKGRQFVFGMNAENTQARRRYERRHPRAVVGSHRRSARLARNTAWSATSGMIRGMPICGGASTGRRTGRRQSASKLEGWRPGPGPPDFLHMKA